MINNIIKRILVPIDGSLYSRRALSEAIKIAKKTNAKIYVVTVVDTSEYPPGMMLALLQKDKRLEESIARFVTAAKSQVRKELLADVAICKSKGIDANYDILIGSPVESLLKFTRGRKMDLIVIGSQGLRGIKKIKTLGSVSRKISELAQCPVMIVH
ncbi:MAG: universal stress protein [Nitrososphaera sp.]|jgi:nucleotide-binding universal stress UspA family protein